MDKDCILSKLEKLKALILILAEVKDGSYDFQDGCTSSVASYLLCKKQIELIEKELEKMENIVFINTNNFITSSFSIEQPTTYYASADLCVELTADMVYKNNYNEEIGYCISI